MKISKGGQISIPATIRHRWGTRTVALDDQGDRMGEMGRYLGEADGPAQRRGHPAGGDPSGDPRTTGPGARAVAARHLHDEAGLVGNDRAVERLQPHQARTVLASVLPG